MVTFAIFLFFHKITKSYKSLRSCFKTTFPKERIATPTNNVDMSFSNNETLFIHSTSRCNAVRYLPKINASLVG
jgi:hypothetical protein